MSDLESEIIVRTLCSRRTFKNFDGMAADSASSFFTSDITMEILSWLPAKALIRFSLVCKAWYSLMTNPSFVTTHFNNSNSYKRFILVLPYLYIAEPYLSVKEEFCFRPCEKILFEHEDFLPPSCYTGMFFDLFCNGLILRFNILNRKLYLCNPSIRKVKSICAGISGYYFYGFGFDKFNSDYKVVRIFKKMPGESKQRTMAEVYSLKADSWRSIETVCQLEFPSTYSVSCNGAVHWWSKSEECNKQNAVICFDVSLEVFREITVPLDVASKHGFVMLFNGLLSLFVTNTSSIQERKRIEYEIWVMKEYGVINSWTKEISGTLEGVCDSILRCAFPNFGCTNGGKLVFLKINDGMLALWDPKTQQLEDLGHQVNCSRVADYMENLALLEGRDRFGADM